MTASNKSAMQRSLEFHPFRGRGLGDATIQLLLDRGLSLPEELLFMDAERVKAIVGIDDAAFAEIEAYQDKIAQAGGTENAAPPVSLVLSDD